MYDIQTLRQTEFPLSQNYIYFNHAGISPLPIRTRDKMQWAIGKLAEQPVNFWSDYAVPAIRKLQTETAVFLNAAAPDEIVPIASTSAGMNAVAQAIDWQAGDNILFYKGEFPSNAYPWMSLERDGVEMRMVTAALAPLSASVERGLTLDAVRKAADAKTRLIAASAIQFFSGHRTELAAIGAFCRQNDILFAVDAIQAAGHIKIDVQAMNIDILAAGGQKSLLSLPGAGFMYVRDEVAAAMHPRSIGPNATRNYQHWLDYDITPRPGAARFTAGTLNIVGIFGLLESMGLLQELGLENIDRHTTQLADTAIEKLTAMGYELATPRRSHGPIVTFKTGLGEEATDDLVANLRQHNISVVKHLDEAGVPYIRLSFHCYNTQAEVAKFMEIFGMMHSDFNSNY